MKKLSHERFFRKMENKKDRVHYLKGIGKIIAPKTYSFKQRGDVICLFYNREEIYRFYSGITVQEIKKFILDHQKDLQKKKKKKKLSKVLKDYCLAPMCTCSKVKSCDDCDEYYKEDALKRKRRGKKIMKPGINNIPSVRESCSFSKTNERFLAKCFNRKWR